MGYEVIQLPSRFRISSENKNLALNACMRLSGQETCGATGELHFAWVAPTSELIDSRSLEDYLVKWRWIPENDNSDSISDLRFSGQKLGDESLLFSTLAPFVEDDSAIVMVGEDGVLWRWLFRNGTVRKQLGQAVFPELSDAPLSGS